MENIRITGGSDEFVRLIRRLEQRISNVENKDTGSMYISGQIVTEDPLTGVATIFGALPDGRFGMQEWVNDIEPPEKPSTPVVKGDRAVYEIIWDGLTASGLTQPPDYDRTVVQMSTGGDIWEEAGYYTAAGRTVVHDQPYDEQKFFRLISYDKNNNASIPSETATATLISFLDSPQMNEYIVGVETAISTADTKATDANTKAGDAITAAEEAALVAANAEKLAQEAGNGNENLVKNNSFEQDFLDWYSETNSGTISTTEFYTGVKSWEIGTSGAGLYQDGIPVQEGQIYNYEMAYKTIPEYASTNAGGLRLQTSIDNGTTFQNALNTTLAVNTEWTVDSKDFTIPSGVTHIRARIAFAGSSTMGVWVDAVKLSNVTTLRALEKTANEAKTIANAAADEAHNATLAANDAATAAGNAMTAANGKNTVWHQETEPVGDTHVNGDIWFDEANGNISKVWRDTAWVSTRDAGISEAISVANTANTAADTAVTTASGKNNNHISIEPPPAVYEGAIGDVWWQKEDTTPFAIISQSHWDGTVWVEDKLTSGMFATIDAGDINVGTLDAAIIGAETITSAHMASGTITAESGVISSLDLGVATVGELSGGRIKAGSLQADRLVVGTGDNLIVDATLKANTPLTLARIAASSSGAQSFSPDYIGWSRSGASSLTHRLKLNTNLDNINLPSIPIQPGRKYVVTWDVYADLATTNTRAVIQWFTSANTLVSDPGDDIALLAGGGAVTSYKQEFTAPANATFANVELEFTSHPGGGWLRFRNPVFRLMTDGTVITEDAITTRHIQASAITGDTLDMAYIRGEVISSTMFQGDTFSGGTFQEATFQTSPLANTGAKMSPTLGFVAYGSDNTPVLSLPPTGNAMFKGSITVVGTNSSIPTSAVTGLNTKIQTLDNTAQTVTAWADPADSTRIDGGMIMTNSIAAEKINLGSTANMIPGGFGPPVGNWDGFTYTEGTPTNSYQGVKGTYRLGENNRAYSEYFEISSVSRYTLTYQFRGPYSGAGHHIRIYFFDATGAVFSVADFGHQTYPNTDVSELKNVSIANQVAPSGAVSARLFITANNTGDLNQTVDNTKMHYFMAFRFSTGAETKLTAAGISSYNNGTQTLRLNGENNLMIGEVITGRPGIEPYIKMSGNSQVGALDFFGVPGGVANHGAFWWNQGALASDAGGGTWGYLSMYAIDDSKTQGTREYYASGIELSANQRIKFRGKLDIDSDLMKSGMVSWSGTSFPPNSFGEGTIVYPRPFPADTDFGQLGVQLTMVSTGGAPLVAVVTSRDNTKFNYTVRNLSSSITSGTTRMNWFVMRNL